MNIHNITNCTKCSATLIAEELQQHVCTKATTVWAIDGKIWIGDGKNWYPLTNRKSTTDSNNGRFNRTTTIVVVGS
jgi:hypothetical protein